MWCRWYLHICTPLQLDAHESFKGAPKFEEHGKTLLLWQVLMAFIYSLSVFILETKTERVMHYRRNEKPEGHHLDLNSSSQEGKPEATLTRHPPLRLV